MAPGSVTVMRTVRTPAPPAVSPTPPTSSAVPWGLGLLVAVFAAADSATLRGSELLAHRIGTSLTVGAGMLGLALGVRPHRAAEVAASLLRQDHIRRCH
jgi:hypothetical protein